MRQSAATGYLEAAEARVRQNSEKLHRPVDPPYLAVSSECFEDPDFPGLCAHHEVHHLANGMDLDICRGEVPRRL
jgi:hypothetical protein